MNTIILCIIVLLYKVDDSRNVTSESADFLSCDVDTDPDANNYLQRSDEY